MSDYNYDVSYDLYSDDPTEDNDFRISPDQNYTDLDLYPTNDLDVSIVPSVVDGDTPGMVNDDLMAEFDPLSTPRSRPIGSDATGHGLKSWLSTLSVGSHESYNEQYLSASDLTAITRDIPEPMPYARRNLQSPDPETSSVDSWATATNEPGFNDFDNNTQRERRDTLVDLINDGLVDNDNDNGAECISTTSTVPLKDASVLSPHMLAYHPRSAYNLPLMIADISGRDAYYDSNSPVKDVVAPVYVYGREPVEDNHSNPQHLSTQQQAARQRGFGGNYLDVVSAAGITNMGQIASQLDGEKQAPTEAGDSSASEIKTGDTAKNSSSSTVIVSDYDSSTYNVDVIDQNSVGDSLRDKDHSERESSLIWDRDKVESSLTQDSVPWNTDSRESFPPDRDSRDDFPQDRDNLPRNIANICSDGDIRDTELTDSTSSSHQDTFGSVRSLIARQIAKQTQAKEETESTEALEQDVIEDVLANSDLPKETTSMGSRVRNMVQMFSSGKKEEGKSPPPSRQESEEKPSSSNQASPEKPQEKSPPKSPQKGVKEKTPPKEKSPQKDTKPKTLTKGEKSDTKSSDTKPIKLDTQSEPKTIIINKGPESPSKGTSKEISKGKGGPSKGSPQKAVPSPKKEVQSKDGPSKGAQSKWKSEQEYEQKIYIKKDKSPEPNEQAPPWAKELLNRQNSADVLNKEKGVVYDSRTGDRTQGAKSPTPAGRKLPPTPTGSNTTDKTSPGKVASSSSKSATSTSSGRDSNIDRNIDKHDKPASSINEKTVTKSNSKYFGGGSTSGSMQQGSKTTTSQAEKVGENVAARRSKSHVSTFARSSSTEPQAVLTDTDETTTKSQSVFVRGSILRASEPVTGAKHEVYEPVSNDDKNVRSSLRNTRSVSVEPESSVDNNSAGGREMDKIAALRAKIQSKYKLSSGESSKEESSTTSRVSERRTERKMDSKPPPAPTSKSKAKPREPRERKHEDPVLDNQDDQLSRIDQLRESIRSKYSVGSGTTTPVRSRATTPNISRASTPGPRSILDEDDFNYDQFLVNRDVTAMGMELGMYQEPMDERTRLEELRRNIQSKYNIPASTTSQRSYSSSLIDEEDDFSYRRNGSHVEEPPPPQRVAKPNPILEEVKSKLAPRLRNKSASILDEDPVLSLPPQPEEEVIDDNPFLMDQSGFYPGSDPYSVDPYSSVVPAYQQPNIAGMSSTEILKQNILNKQRGLPPIDIPQPVVAPEPPKSSIDELKDSILSKYKLGGRSSSSDRLLDGPRQRYQLRPSKSRNDLMDMDDKPAPASSFLNKSYDEEATERTSRPSSRSSFVQGLIDRHTAGSSASSGGTHNSDAPPGSSVRDPSPSRASKFGRTSRLKREPKSESKEEGSWRDRLKARQQQQQQQSNGSSHNGLSGSLPNLAKPFSILDDEINIDTPTSPVPSEGRFSEHASVLSDDDASLIAAEDIRNIANEGSSALGGFCSRCFHELANHSDDIDIGAVQGYNSCMCRCTECKSAAEEFEAFKQGRYVYKSAYERAKEAREEAAKLHQENNNSSQKAGAASATVTDQSSVSSQSVETITSQSLETITNEPNENTQDTSIDDTDSNLIKSCTTSVESSDPDFVQSRRATVIENDTSQDSTKDTLFEPNNNAQEDSTTKDTKLDKAPPETTTQERVLNSVSPGTQDTDQSEAAEKVSVVLSPQEEVHEASVEVEDTAKDELDQGPISGALTLDTLNVQAVEGITPSQTPSPELNITKLTNKISTLTLNLARTPSPNEGTKEVKVISRSVSVASSEDVTDSLGDDIKGHEPDIKEVLDDDNAAPEQSSTEVGVTGDDVGAKDLTDSVFDDDIKGHEPEVKDDIEDSLGANILEQSKEVTIDNVIPSENLMPKDSVIEDDFEIHKPEGKTGVVELLDVALDGRLDRSDCDIDESVLEEIIGHEAELMGKVLDEKLRSQSVSQNLPEQNICDSGQFMDEGVSVVSDTLEKNDCDKGAVEQFLNELKDEHISEEDSERKIDERISKEISDNTTEQNNNNESKLALLHNVHHKHVYSESEGESVDDFVDCVEDIEDVTEQKAAAEVEVVEDETIVEEAEVVVLHQKEDEKNPQRDSESKDAEMSSQNNEEVQDKIEVREGSPHEGPIDFSELTQIKSKAELAQDDEFDDEVEHPPFVERAASEDLIEFEAKGTDDYSDEEQNYEADRSYDVLDDESVDLNDLMDKFAHKEQGNNTQDLLDEEDGVVFDYYDHPMDRVYDPHHSEPREVGDWSPYDTDPELDEPVTDDSSEEDVAAPETIIVSDYKPVESELSDAASSTEPMEGAVGGTDDGTSGIVTVKCNTFKEYPLTHFQTLTERSKSYKQRLEREETTRRTQMRIMRKQHEAHLAEKQTLIRNLEDVIEEQEANIAALNSHIKGEMIVSFIMMYITVVSSYYEL